MSKFTRDDIHLESTYNGYKLILNEKVIGHACSQDEAYSDIRNGDYDDDISSENTNKFECIYLIGMKSSNDTGYPIKFQYNSINQKWMYFDKRYSKYIVYYKSLENAILTLNHIKDRSKAVDYQIFETKKYSDGYIDEKIKALRY